MNLTPSYRTLESLQKGVTYAGRYRNADPIGTPKYPTQPTSYAAPVAQTAAQAPAVSTNNQWVAPYQQVTAPAPQMPAQMAARMPVSTYSVRAAGVPGDPTSGEPLPGGIQQGGRAPEFARPIPNPGSTIDSDPSNRPGQLRFPTGSPIQQPGDADLFAFDQQQPGILQQLFPNFAGNYAGPAPSQRVSEASLEIIDHFGPDVPKVLNDYACNVEDALIQTNQQLIQAELLQELSNEHKAS